MRRALTIATFLLFCAPALLAQGRFHGGSFSGRSFGGGHFGHGGFVGGGSRHGHFGGTRVFVGGNFGFGPNRFGGFFGGGRFHHGRVFFGPGFRHRAFFGFGYGFYGAPFYGYGYYPYYGYPPYYGYYPSYGYEPYVYPPGTYTTAYQGAGNYDRGDDALSREVDRLRDEVDRLKEERYDRERVPQPPPRSEAKPAAPQPATILVFRDGKRVETDNYAIAGQTLWIFSEQRARKVPLTELDLDETRAVNEERGVEFKAGRR